MSARRGVLALVLALVPAPVTAQEGLRFDPGMIESCLADQGGYDCIGLAAHTCVADTPGGNSTAGMVDCFTREGDWWDDALNAAYQELLHSERAGDEWAQSSAETAHRPSGVQAIRTMQRAWIDWRDATCAYERLQWWRGSGEPLVAATCRLWLTAEQTLRLRVYLASGG